MSRLSRPGAETDGGRKHLEVVGRNRPECWQDELDAEGQAEGGERRLAALEALGHQADERDQGGNGGSVQPYRLISTGAPIVASMHRTPMRRAAILATSLASVRNSVTKRSTVSPSCVVTNTV